MITDGSCNVFDCIIGKLSSDLTHIIRHCDGIHYMEITRTEMDIHEQNGGPLPGARIVISEMGTAFFQPEGGEKEYADGNVVVDISLLDHFLGKLGEKWNRCNGIPSHIYQKYSTHVRYKPDHIVKDISSHSVRSSVCSRWFYSERTDTNKLTGTLTCPACTKSFRQVRKSDKRNNISEDKKKSRLQSSSTFPYKFMSPASRKIRKGNVRMNTSAREKSFKNMKLKSEKSKFILDNEQNEEMQKISQIINENYKKELENFWQEAEQIGGNNTKDVLQEIWNLDTIDREHFFKDQEKNITGKSSNYWSTVTYRVALAVYSRSPSAYEALRSFKILQLPSASSLKSFRGTRLHEPGIHLAIKQYVCEQQENYVKYKNELERRGQLVPLHEGILIFDEVKVTSKVKWSSSGQKFFGLSLTEEEFPILNDIYEEYNPLIAALPAEYHLQFLWRDLTSDFDVIGPYFSSAASYDHRFVIASIRETMRLLHACDFLVTGLVCDGASTNLAAIKLMCHGRRGAYGTSNAQDRHEIQPWFSNYFQPDLTVYCCICPSHQMKNMINALYQSRVTGGTKLFKITNDSPYFGWQSIWDLYRREVNRIDAGDLQFVPGMRQSYIDRDPWTKLAVFPAKIMQVMLYKHTCIYNSPVNMPLVASTGPVLVQS